MKLRTIIPKIHGVGISPIKAGKAEKYYPMLSLSLKDFPEAKNWEVGKDYIITTKVRQSDIEQRKNGEGRVGFEILAIGGEAVKEKSEYYSRMKKVARK